ncbi:MAG TPA: amylo-alpha-1,6-glucosidase [Candidatus Solibacter sp.]|nr:amylo-alpha-1,6-glucosidase [Candidatus Solibacter sp.]
MNSGRRTSTAGAEALSCLTLYGTAEAVPFPKHFRAARFVRCAFLIVALANAIGWAQDTPKSVALTRTVRTWEFLPVVGTRAGLFGDETGRFEAWVYPLKIFRDFHLIFHIGDQALPAESLARTLTVKPESASILYAGDSFRVRETLCVPVHEAGAIILLEVETESPLEVEAVFTNDFQLEWPAALGGTYITWDANQHAFYFGEEARKFAAYVGSPTAGDAHVAYQTNYSSSTENSMRLGVTPRGKETKAIVIAGSVAGQPEAAKTYQHLFASYADLIKESGHYYQSYLDSGVRLELPDAALQQAYDWARLSTLQGLVENPYLGTGLVAGYRTSGVGQRPGFAWFFGRDSMWTSFALNAEGDYATSRTAIDFISKYQREDGKVPHEISQSASLVPWFKDYPYPYVSADATPLFIIAVNDYAGQSGDVAFAREKWDNVWRAYQFLKSTYDAQGLAQNFGVGHGWVEGGPLLPVKNEYYQAGLGVEALRALSNLAHLLGKEDVSRQLEAEFEKASSTLDSAFWDAKEQIYAFALNRENQRVDEASVLTTVPMWFGLPSAQNADSMITHLADADQQTDWGMRIISSQSKNYDGSGYHYGSVWPLFTGWASVGEYKYHRALQAYENLRSNALLATDGSLGHFTEVLSGDYYQSFATSSPHQIWSAAMVISPILRGMFGLQTDAARHQIILAPHLPADWTAFALRGVRMGDGAVDFQYSKTAEKIVLEAKRTGSGEGWVEFAPAFGKRTDIVKAELDGKPLQMKVEQHADDQHAVVRFPVAGGGTSRLVIFVKNDFGLAFANELPSLGSASRGLRVASEAWTGKAELTLELSGVAGREYELGVWNAAEVSSVENGEIVGGTLRVQFPAGAEGTYVRRRVVIRFRR